MILPCHQFDAEWDLHLFHEGTHHKLWQKLGAHEMTVDGYEAKGFNTDDVNVFEITPQGKKVWDAWVKVPYVGLGPGPLPQLVVEGDEGRARVLGAGEASDRLAAMAAALDQLQADYPVDTNRVFLAGVSNGAMMAYREALAENPLNDGVLAKIASLRSEGRSRPSSPML